MDFIYEPYFLSFVVALICTSIYYLIQRNKQINIDLEDTPKKKKDLSPELKSILVFILSFSIFTGIFYAIKNYIFPKGDITLLEEIISPVESDIQESVQSTTSLFEKVQSILPSMTLTIPTLFEQKHDENNGGERKIERHEERRERRERRQIDETIIAGKKKSPIKDKESLRFMNSKDARFADNDIDFDLKAFDIKGY